MILRSLSLTAQCGDQHTFYVNISLSFSCDCIHRFYTNPLSDGDGDKFVLHFYDLSAKQPHTLYHFKWQQGGLASLSAACPDAESSAMEMDT